MVAPLRPHRVQRAERRSTSLDSRPAAPFPPRQCGIGGKTVALMSSAHVEGDIHHNSLAIAKGAELTGCRQNEASAWLDGKKNAA